MTAGHYPVFHHLGLPVRLAARRPNGRVLVEHLLRDSHAPQGSWREVDAEKLEHARLSASHRQQLIDVLPLVEFIGDRQPDTGAGYWWDKI